MKIDTRVVDVDSTLSGEKIAMGIDDNALAHIMSLMTDLYSDPELAVIREYSTNAFDAHVEGFGVTRPIEVKTPTPEDPNFTVRDFGSGLDADDIRNIYSRYGTSTKRDSNDVTGMLGLGCKSALTYTDQFFVTGIKNGNRTEVVVRREQDGSGSMIVTYEGLTFDPDGVEVVIPAKPGNSFKAKATHFFQFWQEGTVLVDGEAPARVDGLWLSDDLLFSDKVKCSYIVMGNVAYPMSHYIPQNHHIVAFVNIGDVDFTPSREALQMTEKTTEAVAAIKNRAAFELKDAFERNINEAPSKPEAIVAAQKAAKIIGGGIQYYYYRGERLPATYVSPIDKEGKFTSALISISRWNGYSRKSTEIRHNYPVEAWPKTIWLTGFEGSFTAYKKKKFEQWIKTENLSADKNFVLVDKMPPEIVEWVDPATIMKWEAVKAQKLPKQNVTVTKSGRPAGSYKTAYVNGVYIEGLKAEDIDPEAKVFYVEWGYLNRNYNDTLTNRYKNTVVVVLTPNRVEKFKRDFPAAKTVNDAMKELAEKFFAKVTKEEEMYLLLSHETIRALKVLDASKIDDPELATFVNLASHENKSLREKYQIFGNWKTTTEEVAVDPFAKYPLFGQMPLRYVNLDKIKDHIYLYINAAFAAQK